MKPTTNDNWIIAGVAIVAIIAVVFMAYSSSNSASNTAQKNIAGAAFDTTCGGAGQSPCDDGSCQMRYYPIGPQGNEVCCAVNKYYDNGRCVNPCTGTKQPDANNICVSAPSTGGTTADTTGSNSPVTPVPSDCTAGCDLAYEVGGDSALHTQCLSNC